MKPLLLQSTIDPILQVAYCRFVNWKLFVRFPPMDEVDIGFIENGEISDSAIQHMTVVMDQYKFSHDDLLNEDRRQQIFAKYFDENDQPIQDFN